MTLEQLDKIAVEIVNLLAEKEVFITDIDYIFNTAKNIVSLETKVKKIEV